MRNASAALMLGLFLALGGGAAANDLVVGRKAPPLVLHSLSGDEIASDSLKGKVVILTFWATWCVPCRVELPLLSDYAARHQGEGLEVLAFSLDGPNRLDEVRRVAGTLHFPVGLLGSAYAGGYGRMWRLPVSFVIDREGTLRYDGWINQTEDGWTAEELDRIVTPLLVSP